MLDGWSRVGAFALAVTTVTVVQGARVGAEDARDGEIHACVRDRDDDGAGRLVRIVRVDEPCRRNETRLRWNVAGPEGPVGPQGVPGPPGVCPCGRLCTEPFCAQDVVCAFNDGTFCGTVQGSPSLCPGTCQTGLCGQGNGSVVLGDSDEFSATDFEVEFSTILSRLPQPGEHASGLVTKYKGHSAGDSEWAIFVEKDQTFQPGHPNPFHGMLDEVRIGCPR